MTKEIYDRIRETRKTCAKYSYRVRIVGVLDGDFSKETLDELATDIGYDDMYSVKEALAIVNPVGAP